MTFPSSFDIGSRQIGDGVYNSWVTLATLMTARPSTNKMIAY